MNAVNPSDAATNAEASRHQLLEPADYSQYLLDAKNEILFVLRPLIAAVARITVYFNEGRDFFLTSLVAIGDDHLVLDYGGDDAMNRKALAADKLFCATQHENVKVQFVLHRLSQVEHAGHPAFRAALPDTVLRLQRREFFRLVVPVVRPLRCLVPHVAADGSPTQIEFRIIDISGGGVAIMAPPEGVGFTPGTEFADCRIELPEIGVIVAKLKVCNVFEIAMRNGNHVTRAGCRFINLPGPMLTLVQRYIIKVERDRKARETGMG